ncbi:MAG: STAS domain-containing protein [Candidatus Omnitrophota bacterium]
MGEILSYRKESGACILTFLFNELNLEQRDQLKKELSKLIGAGETRFILNLSKVGFMSSLVIANIVFFTKEVRERKGVLKLCNLSPEALGILAITHLDKIFEIYDTEHDALESLRSIPR